MTLKVSRPTATRTV